MVYKNNSSHSRMPLALTLIGASFVSAFALTFFSQSGNDYWVAEVDMAPGHQITLGDVRLKHMDLDASAPIYLGTADKPLGLVVMRKVEPGEILNNESVSSSNSLSATSAVPVAVRAVDLAAGVQIGDSLDIYWVIDNQNGELPVQPVLILGGITLLNFDQNSKNFGSDAALTLSVEETQVLRLLAATTHGRLVVVRSHV